MRRESQFSGTSHNKLRWGVTDDSGGKDYAVRCCFILLSPPSRTFSLPRPDARLLTISVGNAQHAGTAGMGALVALVATLVMSQLLDVYGRRLFSVVIIVGGTLPTRAVVACMARTLLGVPFARFSSVLLCG